MLIEAGSILMVCGIAACVEYLFPRVREPRLGAN